VPRTFTSGPLDS